VEDSNILSFALYAAILLALTGVAIRYVEKTKEKK
jgi:hypothetical protein